MADIINEYAKAELRDIPAVGEFYTSSITIVQFTQRVQKDSAR